MTSEAFFTALALFLVAEGLLPLLAPRSWRQAFQRLMQFNDGQLRFLGLLLVGSGLLMLVI